MKINCGENIKRQRLLNNLSQPELASRLGIKRGAISSWENNRTEPNMGYIEKMAVIFDCNVSDLVYGFSYTAESGKRDAKLLTDFHELTPAHQDVVLNMISSLILSQNK